MDDIKVIFERFSSYTSAADYDRAFSLMEEEGDIRVITKEENGFIDIEFNNRMGEYKAYLLLEYFNKNKDFYKYFLKRCNKVVIGCKNIALENEIYVNNCPGQIVTEDILRQILTSDEQKNFMNFIIKKIDNGDNLLSHEEYKNFVSNLLLRHILDNKEIDFFEYLDLVGGHFINFESYYQRAMVDMAFQYGYYGGLDLYMKNEFVDDIKGYIFRMIYSKYSLSLFNHLLGNQVKLLSDYTNNNGDDFLENNILELSNFLQIELPKLFLKYKLVGGNKEKIILSREEIINLVVEFLDSVDTTKRLSLEFTENLNNGKIIIWDKLDTNKRKDMMERCSKYDYKNIDGAVCLTDYDISGKITDLLVSVPLTYTLDDVISIVHEFFHCHSNIMSGKNKKSNLVSEVCSIYFEELARNFLLNKGYMASDMDVNFRILDSMYNFKLVMPVINYLVKYVEFGVVTDEMINDVIYDVKNVILADCMKRGLSDFETINELKLNGFDGEVDDIRKNIILNMNCILLREKRGIFKLVPYLLGAVIADNAIVNDCSLDKMLKISDNLNEVSDVTMVMRMVGIDTDKYGFGSSNGISK